MFVLALARLNFWAVRSPAVKCAGAEPEIRAYKNMYGNIMATPPGGGMLGTAPWCLRDTAWRRGSPVRSTRRRGGPAQAECPKISYLSKLDYQGECPSKRK